MRLGEHDRSTTGEGRLPMISIDVVKFTNHENYNSTTYENDISILELAEEQAASLSLVVIHRNTLH